MWQLVQLISRDNGIRKPVTGMDNRRIIAEAGAIPFLGRTLFDCIFQTYCKSRIMVASKNVAAEV
jgi:hypothetical protein